MKKVLISLLTAIIAVGAFAQNTGTGFGYSIVDIRQVAGPKKALVSVFAKDFNYPVKTIQAAVAERLKKEGLKGKGAKNNFTYYQNVKYNPLWNNNCDLYIGYAGNKTTGTVEVLISTGYDNYIDIRDRQTQVRVNEWLNSLELTIQVYLHNQKIEEAEKAHTDAEKEHKKLLKERNKLESDIAKSKAEISKFEAQRTVATQQNNTTVDAKALAKEQKQAQKLQDKRIKLEQKLQQTNSKLAKAKDKVDNHYNEVLELKNNRPQ